MSTTGNRNEQFDSKWSQTLGGSTSEEFNVFIQKGNVPQTQRQLFLYQYYTYIKQKLGNVKLADVLEVGCGRGTVSQYFNVYDGARITLTDVSESAIDLAKHNLAENGATGTALVANADNLPLPSHSFDLVFSIGLLEHLDDYDAIVWEKFRVLRSGGMVASLNIPKKRSIQSMNTWYRAILKLLGSRVELKKDYYRNSHTPEQFVASFERAGFVDIKMVYMTPFPIFTPLPRWAERAVTYVYRFTLALRRPFMEHPFSTNRYVGQAHMVIARKP